MPIAIVVHGGAGKTPTSTLEAFQEGCKEAVRVGWRILEDGGPALDAVEAAVESVINAGYRTEDLREAGKTIVSTKEMGRLITEAIR